MFEALGEVSGLGLGLGLRGFAMRREGREQGQEQEQE